MADSTGFQTPPTPASQMDGRGWVIYGPPLPGRYSLSPVLRLILAAHWEQLLAQDGQCVVTRKVTDLLGVSTRRLREAILNGVTEEHADWIAVRLLGRVPWVIPGWTYMLNDHDPVSARKAAA